MKTRECHDFIVLVVARRCAAAAAMDHDIAICGIHEKKATNETSTDDPDVQTTHEPAPFVETNFNIPEIDAATPMQNSEPESFVIVEVSACKNEPITFLRKSEYILKGYCLKWKGNGKDLPPRTTAWEYVWAAIGSFLGIFIVAVTTQFWLSRHDLTLIIPSFGASAVLIYSGIKSPYAQPRNVILGNMVSAFAGVIVEKAIGEAACNGECDFIAIPIAVSLAIVFQHITSSVHPPGGATAAIAVMGSATIKNLGFLYILLPVCLGSCVLVLVALLVNNISTMRSYPEFWGFARW